MNPLIDWQAGQNSSVLSTGDEALRSSPELRSLGIKSVTVTLNSFIPSVEAR